MNIEPLIYWIREREALRKCKEAYVPVLGLLQPRFTHDHILHTYRFCNVRRRDDRVSRWLRKYVLTTQNYHYDLRSFVMFTAFCRWNNWPPAIKLIMERGLYPAKRINWKAIGVILDELKAEHRKVWTGAYMINAARAEGRTKAVFVTEAVIQDGVGRAFPKLKKAFAANSRRAVWVTLNEISGFGSFMSGQIVDDFGWTPLLWKAKDTYSWAPQGPGSIRGFNRLMELPLKTRHSEEEWCTQLQAWRKEVIAALGVEFRDLDLMSLQSCCCEVDKYLRVKNGEGRPRSVYRPEVAYNV